ncbi:MAG: hypothetical protein S4CHLAM37_04550 [Chlamydiia bacterium]|nr:hypothetical protein [Chlamydiia bacterium]
MKFEIQHTFGYRTLTIEGLDLPQECLCIDSLNLRSNHAVDVLAERVYKAAGLTIPFAGAVNGKREMAIVNLSDKQYSQIKEMCLDAQRTSIDLHLLIRNPSDGRWEAHGNAVKRAFLRVPEEDFERVIAATKHIKVSPGQLKSLNNGYLEDIDAKGNDLADLAMKAFLDGSIKRNVLARALVYVAFSNDYTPDPIHLLSRDGSINEEGCKRLQRRMDWLPSSLNTHVIYGEKIVTSENYKKFIEGLCPEEDMFLLTTDSIMNSIPPALRERLTHFGYKNISVESNGVFYFSKTEDFIGPRRDAFLPYHLLKAPESIHGRPASPANIYDHDTGHQVVDTESSKRAFWTTVGLRCLHLGWKDSANFTLDREFTHPQSDNIRQILSNILHGTTQELEPLSADDVSKVSKIALSVMENYQLEPCRSQ